MPNLQRNREVGRDAGARLGHAATETKGVRLANLWLLAVGFLALAFIAYQPVWRAGFIWDDDDHLTANPAMAAPRGLLQIWSSIPVSRYYPLTLTSFWVQRRLWGLNPLPYHLVNVALHAINALLVFVLLRRLRVPGALVAALVWLLHPVNVESVAWVTELKNTQSGVFFFCACLCFLRCEDGERHADAKHQHASGGVPSRARTGCAAYGVALACGAAAMLSKPSTVVLPLVLLLCVWWERGGWRRVDLMRIAPFFAMALGMSAVAIREQRWQISRSGPLDLEFGMVSRILIASRAVWFYAVKLFWPVPLAFVYPRWKLEMNSLLSWMPLLGLVAVGIVLWVGRRRPWSRAAMFGLGYFVTALLPVLGFFDIFYFRYSFVADHFQYLAGVGLTALATSAALGLTARWGKRGRDAGIVASCAVLLTLGALTRQQAKIYRDEETLWSDTLAKNDGCWMADHNLANFLLRQGDVTDAIAHWQHALQINPALPEVCNNLGTTLFRMGRTRDAIYYWEQALRDDPGYFGAHFNLGTALVQQGRATEGIAHLEQAARIDPTAPEAQLNLAEALLRGGKGRDAIAHFEMALGLQPDSVVSQSRLAWALATLPETEGGDPVRAVTLAQRICEHTGYRVAAHLDVLALAYAAAGRFDEAVSAARKAVDLANATSQPTLAREIESRLELYRNGRMYHPPAATASP